MSGGSIYQLSENGLRNVTMDYEDGGQFERWNWKDISIRVPAGTPQSEISRLLMEKAKQ